MTGRFVAIFALGFLMFLSHARGQIPTYPGDITSWVQQRVGPVVYADSGSGHTWQEYHELAVDLNARAVKIWVTSNSVGDINAALDSDYVHQMIEDFDVIHINVVIAYIMNGYAPGAGGGLGTISPTVLANVKSDWEDAAQFCIDNKRDDNQIFILSVGSELNVWFGTQGAYADFPVDVYVNKCHEGMTATLTAWGANPRPYIFDVAEIQSYKEFDDYVETWVPEFDTDLIALSYYTFRGVREKLAHLRKHAPIQGPFGRNRLMLGEFGPSMEFCNWDNYARANWFREILITAFNEGMQFAFFYEIADNDNVIAAGYHDGLVGFNPNPFYRTAWTFFNDIYASGVWNSYSGTNYESHSLPTPPGGSRPNLIVTQITVSPSTPRDGEDVAFTATVKNTGAVSSGGSSINFFVDNRMVAWSSVGGLGVNATTNVSSVAQDSAFAWLSRAAGSHVVTAVVNPGFNITESSYTDNKTSQSFYSDYIPSPLATENYQDSDGFNLSWGSIALLYGAGTPAYASNQEIGKLTITSDTTTLAYAAAELPASGTITVNPSTTRYCQVMVPYLGPGDRLLVQYKEGAGAWTNLHHDWTDVPGRHGRPHTLDLSSYLSSGSHNLKFRFLVANSNYSTTDTNRAEVDVDWFRIVVASTTFPAAPCYIERPADNSTVSSNQPTLYWGTPDGFTNDLYTLTYSKDPLLKDGTTKTVDNIWGTAYHMPSALSSGRWYWTVAAKARTSLSGPFLEKQLVGNDPTYPENHVYYSFIVP